MIKGKTKFKDGVLTIEIPKVQALPDKAEKKMIAIEGQHQLRGIPKGYWNIPFFYGKIIG